VVENHVLSLKHIILQYINSYSLPLKKAVDQFLGVVKISRPGLQLCHNCKAAILKKGKKLNPGNLYTHVCVSLHTHTHTHIYIYIYRLTHTYV